MTIVISKETVNEVTGRVTVLSPAPHSGGPGSCPGQAMRVCGGNGGTATAIFSELLSPPLNLIPEDTNRSLGHNFRTYIINKCLFILLAYKLQPLITRQWF
jgi:hypothetical protein